MYLDCLDLDVFDYYNIKKKLGKKWKQSIKLFRGLRNMAKWGEGDPRWIVEDRPDATNVNNWHWSEKNATK